MKRTHDIGPDSHTDPVGGPKRRTITNAAPSEDEESQHAQQDLRGPAVDKRRTDDHGSDGGAAHLDDHGTGPSKRADRGHVRQGIRPTNRTWNYTDISEEFTGMTIAGPNSQTSAEQWQHGHQGLRGAAPRRSRTGGHPSRGDITRSDEYDKEPRPKTNTPTTSDGPAPPITKDPEYPGNMNAHGHRTRACDREGEGAHHHAPTPRSTTRWPTCTTNLQHLLYPLQRPRRPPAPHPHDLQRMTPHTHTAQVRAQARPRTRPSPIRKRKGQAKHVNDHHLQRRDHKSGESTSCKTS